MTSQINELGDAARLEIGESLELNQRSVDLVALARRLVADYQLTAGRAPIRLRAAQPEVVGIWDPERLERVVSNLLVNAIKYSPRGGAIAVSVARRQGTGGTWAVLTVRDRGIGIPAADLPHIFERYFRAANAGYLMGSGLGLAGVRQIVELHGGTVTVASKEGHGAAFTVRLPLSPREQP